MPNYCNAYLIIIDVRRDFNGKGGHILVLVFPHAVVIAYIRPNFDMITVYSAMNITVSHMFIA